MVALVVYAANRWLLEPMAAGSTELPHSYVNDILCIPFWMPLLVGCAVRLRLRPAGLPPTPPEIAVVLPLWALLFEGVGPALPALFANTVADPWDLVAYAVGALAAMVIWSPPGARSTRATPSSPPSSPGSALAVSGSSRELRARTG